MSLSLLVHLLFSLIVNIFFDSQLSKLRRHCVPSLKMQHTSQSWIVTTIQRIVTMTTLKQYLSFLSLALILARRRTSQHLLLLQEGVMGATPGAAHLPKGSTSILALSRSHSLTFWTFGVMHLVGGASVSKCTFSLEVLTGRWWLQE